MITSKSWLTVILLLGFAQAFAQSQGEKDKIRELELQRQMNRTRKISQKIDSAVRLSDEGQYAVADAMFRSVLKSIRSVPSDLTFHFGKNSFFLGKFRQSVDWLNKYILNLNYRWDASSKFGINNRYGSFGSVGAAWVFSAEPLVEKNLPWLSFGKLRGSYGSTGNDYLYGNAGADTLNGGLDVDFCNGGAGSDSLVSCG